jgi:hypothetical protein
MIAHHRVVWLINIGEDTMPEQFEQLDELLDTLDASVGRS